MGSSFVKLQKDKTLGRVGLAGILKDAKEQVDVFLQFVPGNVIDAATSEESIVYSDTRDQNCIIARPHFGNSLPNYRTAQTTKYYPLFRGQVDVPIKGDQVLLCTFGGVNYYLGPLNTLNSPNFNIDHLMKGDYDLSDGKLSKGSSFFSRHNISPNFKAIPHRRMQKPYNEDLDFVSTKDKLPWPIGLINNDIAGDMLFEGRHGNSIRIGSRNKHPYMMLSNGRSANNRVEGTLNGSLISITKNGTIAQHFNEDGELVFQGTLLEKLIPKPFTLASDNPDLESSRMLGGELYNYDYNNEQILMTSDKITINSRSDSMFLSSFKDIVLGSGNNLIIKTKNETVIESSNIYLGENSKSENEPLVLGNKLKDFLKEILDIIQSVKVTGTIAGISGPIDAGTLTSLNRLKSKLSRPDFWSEYHFIEDNGQKAD